MSLSISFHRVSEIKTTRLDSGTVVIQLVGDSKFEEVSLFFEDETHAQAFATAVRVSVKNPGDRLFPKVNGQVSGKVA